MTCSTQGPERRNACACSAVRCFWPLASAQARCLPKRRHRIRKRCRRDLGNFRPGSVKRRRRSRASGGSSSSPHGSAEQALSSSLGNMLFVATHEMGHAVISEMDLPALGPEEDAADLFSILTALNVVATEFSRRVLAEAAKGWFLRWPSATSSRGARSARILWPTRPQRAARLSHHLPDGRVSNPVRFKALADETKLPEERRPSCAWDFDTAITVLDARDDAASPQAGDQPRARHRRDVWRRQRLARSVRSTVP